MLYCHSVASLSLSSHPPTHAHHTHAELDEKAQSLEAQLSRDDQCADQEDAADKANYEDEADSKKRKRSRAVLITETMEAKAKLAKAKGEQARAKAMAVPAPATTEARSPVAAGDGDRSNDDDLDSLPDCGQQMSAPTTPKSATKVAKGPTFLPQGRVGLDSPAGSKEVVAESPPTTDRDVAESPGSCARTRPVPPPE